jgi:probable rRNA maturation factor
MRVHVTDEHPSSGLEPETLRSWAEAVLTAEGYPASTEVALTLVGDDQMAQWNHRTMGQLGSTDVLSFPVEQLQPGRVPQIDAGGPPLLVGDVVIAPDHVRRQARELEVDLEDEMALMVTHGILHLLGYDHDDDTEAEAMEERERQILAAMGRRRR